MIVIKIREYCIHLFPINRVVNSDIFHLQTLYFLKKS